MFQWFADYIAKSPWQALAAALAAGLLALALIPVTILCSAIVALALLRFPANTGILVAAGTFAVIAALTPFIPARPGMEIPILLLLIPPVALCAKVLELTRSVALALTLATLIGWLTALSIQLISGDSGQWWSAWLETALVNVPDASMDGFRAEGILPLFNGLVATLYAVAIIVSLLLGRWLQALAVYPGGFAGEFQQVRLTKALPVAMTLILVITYFANGVLFNQFLLIFLTPYFFQGLAVLHATVGDHQRKELLLLPPYLLLFFMPQYVFAGMALVGFSDLFLNFRKVTPPPPKP